MSADDDSVELVAGLVYSISDGVVSCAAAISEGTAIPLPLDGRGAASHSGVGEFERFVGIRATRASSGITATLSTFSNTWGEGVFGLEPVWTGEGVGEASGVPGTLLSVCRSWKSINRIRRAYNTYQSHWNDMCGRIDRNVRTEGNRCQFISRSKHPRI